MSLDPRLVEIPKSLLDLVGEELAREYTLLPLSDDGTLVRLFSSPSRHGALGAALGKLVGEKIGREVEWIPIEHKVVEQAVDEHYATINNCPVEFAFKCPKTWHSLETTDNERVRHCSACQSSVYWCDRASEARKLAKEGKCVAISGKDGADDLTTLMGFVST
jgi:hypothetical protein